MANLDNPHGFAVWDELIRTGLYAVATNPTISVYHQDIVIHGGAHLATRKCGALPTMKVSAVPDQTAGLLGSVVSVFDENLDPVKKILAATIGDGVVSGFVLVADSPDQLFEGQDDETLALDTGGENADIISVALCVGNAITGISTQEIDTSQAGTGSDVQLKLVKPHPLDTAAEANCRYIVQINEHYYGDTMAGIT